MVINISAVEPAQLSPDSKLKFRCHPGISCFTACCSGIDILLTPYDILRMKQRLGISSDEFLDTYGRSFIDKKTQLPQVFMKMQGDEKQSCPFVSEAGCSIYTDRPAACRYYPVGQATHRVEDPEDSSRVTNEEFYVIVREEHCKGFEEDKEWTIDEWRQDQEASLYDEMNRSWKDFLMRHGGLPELMEANEKRQDQFYFASYDLGRFRRFVFESRFLELFEVDEERLEEMREDEVELMRFAFEYLKYLFGMEQTLKAREQGEAS